MSVPTNVTVRVIAVGGKFVGDDIGGAAITIRDADTHELLAQGITKGDSGPNGADGIMNVQLQWGQPLPFTSTTSSYTASLGLSSARRIEVTAFGPLGARASANTVSTTTWLYPGQFITAGNGILLQLPGLICQVVNPPTHTANLQAPANVTVVANIAMMCGCPISDKAAGAINPGPVQPWLPSDFDVVAVIPQPSGNAICSPLTWDAQSNVAGRFTGVLEGLGKGTYQMTVFAHQKSTGNTGVDLSTFIVQPPAS